MHFYRRLKPIKAITFDLDDTLYDNYPVILKTTEESHRFLQAYHPSLRHRIVSKITRPAAGRGA